MQALRPDHGRHPDSAIQATSAWKKGFVLRVIQSAILLVLLEGTASAWQHQFSDGDFDPADWSLTVLVHGAGSIDADRVNSGGNPGAFRQARNHVRFGPQERDWVAGFHHHLPSAYDPSALGAIGRIEYSMDYANIPDDTPNCCGQQFGFAVRQAGSLFVAPSILSGNVEAWLSTGVITLMREDFRYVLDPTQNDWVDDTQHPDFSASAAPIELGFFTFNSTTADINYDIIVGYDNWTAVVHPCDEASWANYGAGFPGTLDVPSLTVSADPCLGCDITIDIGNSLGAQTTGIMFIGLQAISVPGSWGGDLLVNPLLVLSLTIPAAGLSLPATIADDPALCGLSMFNQVLEIDAGAAKGISNSAGLELIVGS